MFKILKFLKISKKYQAIKINKFYQKSKEKHNHKNDMCKIKLLNKKKSQNLIKKQKNKLKYPT